MTTCSTCPGTHRFFRLWQTRRESGSTHPGTATTACSSPDTPTAAPEEGQLLFTNPEVTSLQQSRGNAFQALTRAWLQSCRGSEADSRAELLCQPREVGTCHRVDRTATGLSYLILCHTFIYFSCGSFITIAQY